MEIVHTLKTYSAAAFGEDLAAGIVVAIVLVPSAMAYALLAGLPAHVGLYASVLPLLLYPLFARSRIISVGPVTIVSLMTASTLASLAPVGSADYLHYAAALALLSAVFLGLASLFDVQRYVGVLKHTVLAGFLSAVGVIIACSQLKSLIGVSLPKSEFAPLQIWHALTHFQQWNSATLALGLACAASLIWKSELSGRAARARTTNTSRAQAVAGHLNRAMPLVVVVVAICLSTMFSLPETTGIKVIGALPTAFPEFTLPHLGLEAWRILIPGAILMSTIGLLECVSVVKGLEAKSGERLDLRQELAALATANLGASLSSGYPVSGGTVRSVVNFNAGARTCLANAFAGLAVLACLVICGPLIARLPIAVLAAIVMAASISIVDLKPLYRSGLGPDAVRYAGTFALTLLASPEMGLAAAIALSLTPDAWLEPRAYPIIDFGRGVGIGGPVSAVPLIHVAPSDTDERASRPEAIPRLGR